MNPEDINAFKLQNPEDIFLLHVFLVNSVDDLSSMDTLCEALHITKEDVEDLLQQEMSK